MKFILDLFKPGYRHSEASANDPNRNVPLSLKIGLITKKSLFWVGLLFALTCTIFFVKSILIPNFQSLSFGNNSSKTKARIIRIGFSEYTENRTPYFEYKYEYNIDGSKYSGHSFGLENTSKLDSIVIEYQIKTPSVSRIQGMRMTPPSFYNLLFILILILGGLISMLLSFKVAYDEFLLIKYGFITEAYILNIQTYKPENVRNAATSYDVDIEFTTNKGRKIKTFINGHHV